MGDITSLETVGLKEIIDRAYALSIIKDVSEITQEADHLFRCFPKEIREILTEHNQNSEYKEGQDRIELILAIAKLHPIARYSLIESVGQVKEYLENDTMASLTRQELDILLGIFSLIQKIGVKSKRLLGDALDTLGVHKSYVIIKIDGRESEVGRIYHLSKEVEESLGWGQTSHPVIP